MLLLTTVSGASAVTVIGGTSGPTAVFVSNASAADETPSPGPSPTPVPTAAPVVNADFDIKVDMGYEGLVIMNTWTPTYITVTNNGGAFIGTLGVNVFTTTTEYDRYEIPFEIASGATKRVLLPIKPLMRQDMYAFELVADGNIVAESRTAPKRLVAPETVTVGLLSESPQSLAYMDQRANSANTLRGEVWLSVPLTADTFPQTKQLMDTFSMLVVDGFDVRTLSEEQQEVLTTWLRAGGIVYVSGGAKAATGYPFFSEWTGLTGGKPSQHEDITPTLLSYTAVRGTAVEEDIWLNQIPATEAIVATEDTGLIACHTAGEGLIYSAAFDMGGKPLSSWTSMTAIWPGILRQNAPVQYSDMLNTLDNLRYGDNSLYQARELINQLRVDNNESGIPVIILLAVYLLLVGFGGYLILKKFDKREWMWGYTPAVAIIFAVLLLVLSQGSTMNKPVALTASRIAFEGSSAQMETYLGVATPNSSEVTIGTDAGVLPSVLSDSYYYGDDGDNDRLFRPLSMRQRYSFGTTPSIGFGSGETWDIRMLQLAGMKAQVGSIDATMWIEEDGIHGEIVNNTDYTYKDCIVVTTFGYSKIDTILPGQKATFAMLYSKAPITRNTSNYAEPDILYTTLDIDQAMLTSGYYSDNGLYNYLNSAIYGKTNDYENTVARQKFAMVQLFERDWSFYEGSSMFYFFGFNDALGQVQVTLNDVPVTRTAHTAVVGSRITFNPVGPTGMVLYPQGTISAETLVDQGDEEKGRPPVSEDTVNNNNYGNPSYLSLSGPTGIRFMLPDWGTYRIDRMTLAGVTYETTPTMYLYNNETETWDEQILLTVSMNGAKWAPYIDDEGGIYVRYVPSEMANRYEGMQMPTITLKGEVK